MSDDTPTQRFDQQPAATPSTGKRKRSPLIPILITAGAILLIAVVVLVVLLLGRNATGTLALSTNTPSSGATTQPPATPVTTPVDTPAPTQSATSTQAPPPPPDTTLGFTTFLVQSKINSCSSGPYYTGAPPIVKVTWATKNAVSAWIVQGTSDAADSKFMQIPLHGTQANFPSEIDFQCGTPSSTFTITLVGQNGQHLSKHWTVINTTPNG